MKLSIILIHILGNADIYSIPDGGFQNSISICIYELSTLLWIEHLQCCPLLRVLMRMFLRVFSIKYFIVMGTFVNALLYIIEGSEMAAWSFVNNQPSYKNLTDGYYCTVCVNKVYKQPSWWSTEKELQNSGWDNYCYSSFPSHLVTVLLCPCALWCFVLPYFMEVSVKLQTAPLSVV